MIAIVNVRKTILVPQRKAKTLSWYLPADRFRALHQFHRAPYNHNMGFGDRGVIADKWSSRILWVCAIGSAIGLYMVAVERQMQNRAKMMAEALKAESGADDGE